MSNWRVTINGTYLGQNVANILGVGGPGDVPAGVQGLDVATKVRGIWVREVIPSLSSSYTVTTVEAVSITNPEIGESVTGASAGGQSVAVMTGAICAAVDIRTGLRGRSFRGRTGLTGLVEADVDGNALTEVRRGDLDARMNTFRNQMGAVTAESAEVYTIGVVSRISQGVKRLVPIYTPSTSISVRSRVGTRVTRLR